MSSKWSARQGDAVAAEQSRLITHHCLEQVVYDIETGRSRGFGFVKFDDPRDAEDAINDADGKVSLDQR